MPELSPVAQAVLEASAECWAGTRTQAIAAALRAAADQVVPQALCVYNPESISIRSQLLAIANELTNQ
jgi:hypothetical protein